jgi:hypothetical protein
MLNQESEDIMNQQVKQPPLKMWWILFGMLLLAFVVFVILANRFDLEWTGFTANTLWDWLKYLIIPVTLVIAPVLWASLRQSQHRKQVWRKWRIFWIVLLVVFLVASVVLVIKGYNDWSWTGFAGNTLWDWISLLFLPVTLVSATLWFTKYQNRTQTQTLLGLIPTAPLPKNPFPRSSGFTTVLPPNTPLSVPQQPGASPQPQWRPLQRPLLLKRWAGDNSALASLDARL